MSEKEENSQEPKELNYKNNATQIHPLIAQLYRCELEENGENGKEKEEEKERKKEKSPPQPIYRAADHKQEVFWGKLKYFLFFIQFDPDKYLEVGNCFLIDLFILF